MTHLPAPFHTAFLHFIQAFLDNNARNESHYRSPSRDPINHLCSQLPHRAAEAIKQPLSSESWAEELEILFQNSNLFHTHGTTAIFNQLHYHFTFFTETLDKHQTIWADHLKHYLEEHQPLAICRILSLLFIPEQCLQTISKVALSDISYADLEVRLDHSARRLLFVRNQLNLSSPELLEDIKLTLQKKEFSLLRDVVHTELARLADPCFPVRFCFFNDEKFKETAYAYCSKAHTLDHASFSAFLPYAKQKDPQFMSKGVALQPNGPQAGATLPSPFISPQVANECFHQWDANAHWFKDVYNPAQLIAWLSHGGKAFPSFLNRIPQNASWIHAIEDHLRLNLPDKTSILVSKGPRLSGADFALLMGKEKELELITHRFGPPKLDRIGEFIHYHTQQPNLDDQQKEALLVRFSALEQRELTATLKTSHSSTQSASETQNSAQTMKPKTRRL